MHIKLFKQTFEIIAITKTHSDEKNRLQRVIQKQLVLVGSGSWFVASVPFMFKYNAHNRRI